MLKTIGITGNSGSGKTTVCNILRQRGAHIIDADKIARYLAEPGQPVYDALIAAFGVAILQSDATINRQKLADIAFATEEGRQKLMAATHPPIVAEIRREMTAIQQNPNGVRLIVLDAPLLVEAGLHHDVSAVWLVEADAALKQSRVMARDSLTADQAESRLNAQPAETALVAYATHVLSNNGNLADLEAQVCVHLQALIKNGKGVYPCKSKKAIRRH